MPNLQNDDSYLTWTDLVTPLELPLEHHDNVALSVGLVRQRVCLCGLPDSNQLELLAGEPPGNEHLFAIHLLSICNPWKERKG